MRSPDSNPVAELVRVIQRGRALDPEMSARAALKAMLHISEGSDWLLVSALASLHEAAVEGRMLVEASNGGDAGSAAAAAYSEIEAFLDQTLSLEGRSIGSVLTPVTDASMRVLEEASSRLVSLGVRSPAIGQSQIEELRSKTLQLIVAVEGSDDLRLSEKRAILRLLFEVADNITGAVLQGADGILAARTNIRASMIENPSLWQRIVSSPLAKSVWGLALAIDLALNAASNFEGLIGTDPDPVTVQLWVDCGGQPVQESPTDPIGLGGAPTPVDHGKSKE